MNHLMHEVGAFVVGSVILVAALLVFGILVYLVAARFGVEKHIFPDDKDEWQ